jgi:RHS repeat-associated protein
LTGSPLVVPGVDSLVGGALSQAARNAALMTPEAQDLRSASQTEFEGLSAAGAEGVANSAFASVVDDPDGGPPVLPEGESITGFPSDYAASIAFVEGQHAVLESSAPVATEVPGGGYVPLNLHPRAVNGGYEAVTASTGVGVRAGDRLSEGVSLAGIGLSLTPVTQTGAPLESSGVPDGASVFYGDSEDQQAGIVDLDSLVKLDAHGFREDALLRSERAPSKLYYRVGLPQGATLAQEGSGSVVVVAAGRPIAVIATAAQDAEGTQVPVSVSLADDLLVLDVEHAAGQYRMPIEVDPTVSEGEDMGRYQMGRNWEFEAESPKDIFTNFEPKYGEHGMEDHDPYGREYTKEEFGSFAYQTGGESRIYEFVSRSYNKNPATISSTVFIRGEGGVESAVQTAGEKNTICVVEGCAATMGSSSNWENAAMYSQLAVANGSGEFEDLLEEATEYVVQEKGPSISSLSTCGGVWINTSYCDLELNASDPGLGVKEVIFSSSGSPGWGGKDKVCQVIQCTSSGTYSESAKGLAEGEDTVKATVKDPVGLSASSEGTVKIDNAPPHSLVLSGLGPGNQVGPGEYKLKAEATDGSGSTLSSGINSISVLIDGREVGSSSALCSPGPCTGHSATWSIFGHNYATGKHTVTIVATDNAGNAATEQVTMAVRPASPVALGPGLVNSGSGELSLSATDVSMPGGLTVSRSYGSQHLTAGAGGPVGPQWALSLGGEENLIKQPNGSMVLTEGSGAQTIFSPNGSGGYLSPAGDSNLSLSGTPCEAGQTEFMLKNAAANTTTCFKVPSGGSGEVWSPSITKGPVATDTVTYAFQTVEVPAGSKNMVTRPTEALAPVPAGVSCSPTLKAGCRALTFNYGYWTRAKGEALSEWGEYEGDLESIEYTAWNPVAKNMRVTDVARYSYDNRGRLRAEWDPRITPEPLKTYYGYDSEGHLTAITPPGEQTWAFVYGTMSASTTSGVALKARQAPTNEKEEVWSGATLANTVAPEVSGSSTTGIRMTVSEGAWTGSPVLYGYQWEDCNSSGGECTGIDGATNANYTPTSKDEGHRLAVVVTATNGSGTVSVTALAPLTTPSFSMSFGVYGTGNGQLREPEGGLATDASGNVWVTDTMNSRLEEFNGKGEFVRIVGSSGEGAGQFKTTYGLAVDSKGDIWATDQGNDRVEEFNNEGVFLKALGWGVSNGESKLEVCTSSCRAGLQGSGNGEFFGPEGIAVDSKGDVYVADRGNHRVQEFSPELAWVRNLVQTEEHQGPFDLTVDASNNIWVAYSWENKIGEFNSEGKLVRTWGTTGSEPGDLLDPYGVGIGPEGNVWVPEYGNNRVQVFTTTGSYLYGFGSKGAGAGEFNDSPQGIAFTGSSTVYVLDSGIWWENTGNSRIEKWNIPDFGKDSVHDTQTIYYTTAANSKYTNCGEHPEWANLPCQTQPAEQPETSGLPNLPVTTYTYNLYDEPLMTVSTVGSETRTTTDTYDEAGRLESAETTSTVGTALPKLTEKYSTTNGMLDEQSAGSESLKSEYNTLGQLTSYIDADGNLTTYEYEKEKDYRLKKINDGKGTQTYEYSPTTGAVTELVDSEAGKFTASYDTEGNLISEGYPNAMNANYTVNPAGQLTGLTYIKTAHCAKTCPETWYSDTVVPSIHGQWLSQQSELESKQTTQAYTYDQAGRLTQTTDNVGGKDCITRLYIYDEETNRLSSTTRPPGTGGACTIEGGETQNHTYDPANRLTDPGTKYDPFGNTTELPASDAGGTTLTSTYYQDNQLASQTQGAQTIGYQLDPAGRTREIVSTGKVTATEIQHYTNPSSRTPAWTGELSTNYTRNVTGISGELVATQHNGETPILQLANLHGDVIATAKDSETTTTLASTIAEASEYGVPATETPPKYSWLGSHELPTALPSGVMTMGVRSYVPQLGRFLQTDPVPGGSANAYAYVFGDPVNADDLNGERAGKGLSAWILTGMKEMAHQETIAYETALREEAERKAREAAEAARAYAAMTGGSPEGEYYEEEGPEEEYWEEEGEEEYASYHYGGEAEHATGQTEEGLLYQPLVEGANIDNNETGAPLGGNGFKGGDGIVRDVKGGPGGGCARTKNCKRQHEIWSKAGSRGPSIEEEARKFWHGLKCEIMTAGQIGAEQTTIGHAMAEHGELKARKC